MQIEVIIPDPDEQRDKQSDTASALPETWRQKSHRRFMEQQRRRLYTTGAGRRTR